MKNKNIILFLLIIIVINGVSLLAGALNWLNQFFIVGTLFFFSGLFFDERWRINKYLYALLLLLPFMGIYTAFILIKGFSHVYPIAFIPLLALPSGMFLHEKFHAKTQTVKKYTMSVFVIALMAAGGYMGMPNWLAFTLNKTSTQVMPEGEGLPDIIFSDMNDSLYYLRNQKGKVVVMDFWSTSCGICYKQFPEFEKLYETFKDNEDVSIYAVNMALKNQTTEQIKEKVKELGYSFPNLFVTFENRNNIKNTLQFNVVPTLIIFNKKGDLYYKGNLLTSELVIVNNTYRMIEKLLKLKEQDKR